jgi:multimeric flavodoxin WrbA
LDLSSIRGDGMIFPFLREIIVMIKALVLLATLKKDEPSNTEALTEFFTRRLAARDVSCETIKLVTERILPGTYTDLGEGDAWPGILSKLVAADIILFATPIWWGSHSSEMQKVIERLDEIHDEILAGRPSRLDNKVAGVLITGDSDGAEHIIGCLANFFNSIGVVFPPYCTLPVLWDGQKKNGSKPKAELLAKYEKEYGSMADKMVGQLLKYV